MRKAALIAHQTKEPQILPIKVVTEFEPIPLQIEPKPEQILARLFVYTRHAVFRGEIKKQDINTQLAWNQNSLNALNDSLNGKRNAIDIRFNELNGRMSLICEIESGIRINLFDIITTQLQGQQPLPHMKQVFLSYRLLYLQQENKIKQDKDKIISQMKQTQALAKQIEEQAQTDIIHMKKNFVDIINQCKKQLRKHMQTGIIEANQEEELEDNIKRRAIVRVNKEALEKQVVQKNGQPMEVEKQPQRGFEDLFDQ